jgi:hypothetical protein
MQNQMSVDSLPTAVAFEIRSRTNTRTRARTISDGNNNNNNSRMNRARTVSSGDMNLIELMNIDMEIVFNDLEPPDSPGIPIRRAVRGSESGGGGTGND